jgi:RNA polymerase sigma-70 factor (ECF subfamily)
VAETGSPRGDTPAQDSFVAKRETVDEPGTLDDPALLDRARGPGRSGAEAFRMIFERHAPAVRRFAGGVLRDGPAADEATQETFVRAHARLSSVRDGTRLRGWLLGIARIVMLDAQALQQREVASSTPIGGDVAGGGDPELTLLSAEADEVLAAQLAALSAERRAAVILRLDQHLSYDEIAQAMGWPLQKVKNEIHRARLQIRAALLAYLEDKP